MTDFQKILKYQISWKSVLEGSELLHVDRHDEAKSLFFCNFAEVPKKSIKCTLTNKVTRVERWILYFNKHNFHSCSLHLGILNLNSTAYSCGFYQHYQQLKNQITCKISGFCHGIGYIQIFNILIFYVKHLCTWESGK